MAAVSEREYHILTNNPMAARILKDRFSTEYLPEATLREILVLARDRVYGGHILYTHPLAGSVKPNETPYKSVVISRKTVGFDPEQGLIMENAIAVCDKFPNREKVTDRKVLEDLQLIDYTLLCSGIGFDAAAGLSGAGDKL